MKSERPHVGGVLMAVIAIAASNVTAQDNLRFAKQLRMVVADQEQSAMREAAVALKRNDFAKAEQLYAAAAATADLDAAPMTWLSAELNLCHSLALQGRKQDAILRAQSVVDRCELHLGAADPATNEALTYLGFLLRNAGRAQDAEQVYRRNLGLLESKYGRTHFFVAGAASRLGVLLHSLGRIDEAEALHRRALEIVRTTADESRPDACVILTNLADCLLQRGKRAEALPLMDRAFEIVQRTKNADLPSAGMVLRKQAAFYQAIQQLDRAEELGRRALARLAERHDSDRAKFFYYESVKGVYSGILRDRGLTDAAIQAAIKSLESSRNSASVDLTE